jgi:hypothetical protein
MIIVRNVFRLKFGTAREARELWEEGEPLVARAMRGPVRLMTDLVGPFYTLVMESTHASLAAYESAVGSGMADPEWKTWYNRFVPLVESGYREVFSLIETD